MNANKRRIETTQDFRSMAKNAPAGNAGFEAPIPDTALPVLHALIVASAVPQGFLWMPEDEAKAFEAAGFASIHPEAKDGAAVAVQVTDEGKNYGNAHPAVASADYEAGTGDPMAKPDDKPAPQAKRTDTGFKRPASFEIEKSVALPPTIRGRGASGGGSAYPFDALEPGDSFHIAATPENDDPAKSVASSVSTATLRYTEVVKDADGKPVMETRKVKHRGREYEKDFEKRTDPSRTFTVRSVGKDDPKGPGCRVWRLT